MGKTSVPQQKVLLCSLCTSTLLVAEVNRIPHYTASAIQQGNSSCLSPPWRSLAPQLQGPGTRLGEYPRITDVLPPSVPTDSVWLLPLPAPPARRSQDALVHALGNTGATTHVCGSAGSSQVGRKEPAASSPSLPG